MKRPLLHQVRNESAQVKVLTRLQAPCSKDTFAVFVHCCVPASGKVSGLERCSTKRNNLRITGIWLRLPCWNKKSIPDVYVCLGAKVLSSDLSYQVDLSSPIVQGLAEAILLIFFRVLVQ
jgi:hypothetical protein